MERNAVKVSREDPLATAGSGDAKKVSMNSAVPHGSTLTVSGGPQSFVNLDLPRLVR